MYEESTQVKFLITLKFIDGYNVTNGLSNNEDYGFSNCGDLSGSKLLLVNEIFRVDIIIMI